MAELTNTILTANEVRDLVERMLRNSGRRVDLSSPFVDATLADGSRLHVVIPDITRDHWHVNIRKFVVKADHLEDLVRLGTLTRPAQDFLAAAVVSGLNILVAGGTQAGNPGAHVGNEFQLDPASESLTGLVGTLGPSTVRWRSICCGLQCLG